jgi:hypothetical protein
VPIAKETTAEGGWVKVGELTIDANLLLVHSDDGSALFQSAHDWSSPPPALAASLGSASILRIKVTAVRVCGLSQRR